ncbi:hypothetical protein N7520_006986 [Penicillium odoratum]|uniref:uncharacterized protein n=1 Tax=Penicillium odoratum TaxID=1167516 RepID=UPI002546F8D4|nr:uncharacterized protein N7520_006986 [Penicillium odoratum]KAJ5759830.1 hypothetical protein N7520_006986 [Penicillium odoratum]
MDFDYFIDLCGRSLFAEEYKGDFDAAWEYLQSVRSDKLDLSESAEFLRCSSIYAILVGNFADAYNHLESLHTLLPQLPQEWGLRYTNYKVLADYTRRFPPALRFYHERGWPLNTVMLNDIIGPKVISQNFMANISKYLPLGVPRDQGLSLVLNQVMWTAPHVRDLAFRFHPLSPPGTRNESTPAQQIAQITSPWLKYRADADANGAASIAAYLTRLVVEAHVACQSPETGIMLDDLYQRCERMDDLAGMANAKLMEGDNILCVPFTSPLAMNLIVLDTTGLIGNDAIWDPIERSLEFDYSADVKQCYDSAYKLFRKCKRGRAMVLLRQGCCLHHAARCRRHVDKPYFDLLGEAEVKFQEALEMFGRDEAHLQLVKAHQILLAITKGNIQRVKTAAREIGTWCAGAKNEILAHFIGQLISIFANQEWIEYFNMDAALQAWECAYEVLMPIGDMIPLFQIVLGRVTLQHEWNNMAAVRILMKEALAMVDGVLEYFRDRISSIPDTEQGETDRKIVRVRKATVFWNFDQIFRKVFCEYDDLSSPSEWPAKFNHLLETDEDLRAWVKQVENMDHDTRLFKGRIALLKGGFKNVWQRGLAENEISTKHRFAQAGYQRLLDEGDILEAEDTLRRYLNETEHKEPTRIDILRVLAADYIGDRVKARQILDSITDDLLFDGHLESYRQGLDLRSSLPLSAQNALVGCLRGGDMERGRRCIKMIIEMIPGFFDSFLDNGLDHSFRLGQYAALMKELQPEISFTMLLRAREIVETRIKQMSDPDARVWSSNGPWRTEVYLDLARICLTAEQSPLPISLLSGYAHGHPEGISWTDHALLFIEMSRARAVLEVLQTQATNSGAPKTMLISEAIHKRRLLRSLLSLKTLTADQEEEIAQLQEEITGLEEDGTLSSATTFIETVNSTIEPNLLYQSIDNNAVVIEATFDSRGLIAFAVTSDGIQQISQSSIKQVDIRRPVMRAMKIMREMNGYISEEEGNRKSTLNDLCNEISEVLLVPFAETIRTKSHVIFSVSNPLTAFPFSILPFDHKPLIMQAEVSQVPSMSVLYYLSQRKSASVSPTVSVLAKSPTEEPYGATRGGEEVNLHMAGIEAVNIARMFGTWPIEASQLSRKDFQHYIEGGSPIMHIGTHGDINPRNPLLSSISIGQGQEFRVVDMSAIQSNVNLLVFAACLSGLGKATIGMGCGGSHASGAVASPTFGHGKGRDTS